MFRQRLLLVAMTVAISASAQAQSKPAGASAAATAATASAANPFFKASTLQYQAPPFDKIGDADFQPASEEGMQQQLAEIEKIAGQSAAPTFANTVEAMERSGALLTRVGKVFYALAQANTNDTLQQVQRDEAPKLAAHQDAIFLNPKLFARIEAIYAARDKLPADEKFLIERYHRQFVRAGAKLSEADKATLRELNKEESTLQTAFQNKLLAATKAGAISTANKAEFAGLSDGELAAAAAAAKERKLDGEWLLTLQNTTQQPAQAELTNRATRERLFNASTQRSEHNDANDERATVARLAQLRAQKAKLLGYPTYAAYSLEDQMAKTPEHAIKLMTDMVPAVRAKTEDEAAQMQEQVDAQKGGFKLAPWDWQFYSEQVKQKKFKLDESEVKQYFELDRVLHDGVFYAANKLYGITFKERHDLPVYQPDVRVFEVFDADGKSLALWYADYFKRDSKSGGAWMDSFVDQSSLLGTRPVVFNVTNFAKPAPGQPALLSFDDVNTIFHEFGHALHGLLSNNNYPTISGTNVSRDFVEFPSQFNEHWALQPQVFAHYAKNYKTGEPMPQALVDKIKKSRTFNQGYALTEYLAAALLDQAWHTLPAGTPKQDVNAFETAALQRFQIDMAQVPPRYHTTYFSHIWGGGYSAGYYAYLWSEVIDDDAYAWFEENGGLTRANGQRFREMVLSRGGSMDAAAMYRAFRGRDPIVEPLLIQRGLKDAPK